MVTNAIQKTKAGEGDREYWWKGSFFLPNFKLGAQEIAY